MKKTLLASTAILALSAIGFTNTAHATEESTKAVNVQEGRVSGSLALTNPDVTSVDFDFAQIDFENEKPLNPETFSVTYDIQNRTFANIAGRFTIAVSTEGSGLNADFVNEGDSNISETNSGTKNTGDVTIEATLDPTLYNDEQKELYKITVSLIDSTTVTP
ncbi:MAG: hypothetical protein JTJ28_10035 [Lactobacillus sp.]|jgi:hypothetical protein|nr:hypothetical protein [Lactobacillus sp.]